ncbi:hypothetical protein VMT65_25085 [Nocardia sp. CDC153]|uniref:LGFP repeat-containing protein n=1 Tax=Nocardia sp. CDC153 TaxID=3112167 RepID=UPI002DBF8063|nr:hypothetical protein [Nocardia sp. CDC153]MEC3956337.1 hypothetical protein [Nocardia sp. CDC153]
MHWRNEEKGDKAGQLAPPFVDKYRAVGGPTGFLGFPYDVHDAPTPDGVGRFLHFEYGGIYTSPAIGVHEIHGEIWKKWSDQGWEQGDLGYPTSDEQPGPHGTGRANSFQNGWIYWTSASGAFATIGHAVPDQIVVTNKNFTFSNNTPVGGWATVTLNSDGSCAFSGHVHDSGAPDYDVSASCAVVAVHTGTAYILQHTGSTSGDISVLSGSRDMDWNDHGSHPELTAGWLDLNASYEVTWNLTASMSLSSWIDLVKKAYPYVQTAVALLA